MFRLEKEEDVVVLGEWNTVTVPSLIISLLLFWMAFSKDIYNISVSERSDEKEIRALRGTTSAVG